MLYSALDKVLFHTVILLPLEAILLIPGTEDKPAPNQ